MRAYCGQTREPQLSQRLADAGVGECTVRGELLSRKRDPWFYDNGAFRDWKAGTPFNAVRFERDMRRIRYSKGSDGAPDFVVLPDIVAGGEASLDFSRQFIWDLDELPAYLAVQDGMTIPMIRDYFESVGADEGRFFEGIFVGGTLAWKLETAASWVDFAHETKRRCHVGRVGTPDRVRWASAIGADSIDSCLPLMYEEHLVSFLDALVACGGSS